MFPLFKRNRRLTTILNAISIFFLIVTASNFFVEATQAQTNTKADQKSDTTYRRLEIGFAAGLAVNHFASAQPHMGANRGGAAGLSFNYLVYKNMSLQVEVNFLQQGGRMILFKDDTRLGLPESLETKNVTNNSYMLNSIEIPLLVHYTLPVKQAWKPSFYVGASYVNTFNVKEKYQKTGDLLPGEDIIATVSDTRNATNSFNASKMNLIVGANLKLPLTSKLQMLVDMRYLNGITPSRENYSYMDKVGFGTDVRTNTFLSRLGIIMPL